MNKVKDKNKEWRGLLATADIKGLKGIIMGH